MRRAAMAAILGFAAGCQTAAPGGPEGTEWTLRSEAALHPEDRALQQKWKESRSRAAADRLAKIDGAIQAGDLQAAERHAEVAVYYAPDDAAARRRLGEIRTLRRDVREQIRLADESIRRSDWVRARRFLEPIAGYKTTYPQLAEMWPAVAKENTAFAMREGERFLKVMDYEESRAWFEDALALTPGDAAATGKRQLAADRARARVLAHEAEDHLAAGQFDEAVVRARDAAKLHGDSPYVRSMLEETLRRTALEYLDLERKSRAAGQLREALSAVRRAHALDVPQEGLWAEIDARNGIAAKEASAKLVAAGRLEERSGRAGAAWVYYSIAARIQPAFPGVQERLGQAAARAASRAQYRVVVLPGAEGLKTAPGSGELFAAAIREAIGTTFSGAVWAYGPGDLRDSVFKDSKLPPDGALGGKLDEAWLSSGPPKIERLSVRYESGRVPKLNGNVEALKEKWEQSQAALPPSAKNVAESEQRLAAARADRDRAQADHDETSGRAAATPQEQEQKTADLQKSSARLQQAREKMAQQESETRAAREAHVAIEREIQGKLDAYLAEPPYVFEPIFREFPYEKALFETRATLAARLALRDFASGESSGETAVKASFAVEDTVIPSFEEAGLKGDPVDMPKDADLLSRLVREGALDLCAKLETALRRHGERLLARAARERAAGFAAAELHYLALAWHARAALEENRRAELIARVRECSGLDLEGSDVDVSRLPEAPLKP